MNIYYNGVDIYGDISLNYAVHEMFAEKQADSLVLRFNDPNGVWSEWEPAEGDEIQLKEGYADTGIMYVHRMTPENGFFTVRALSIPLSAKTKNSNSWEGVRLLQLGEQIAEAHGLGFSEAHQECVDIILNGSFLQQGCKFFGGCDKALVGEVCAYDDAAGVEVVVKSTALTEKFRRENDVAASCALTYSGCKSHWYGGLYDHYCFWIAPHHKFNDSFNSTCVEEIFLAVVVCGSGNNHIFSLAICLFGIESCMKIKLLVSQEVFNLAVNDGRAAIVDHVNLLGNDVYSCHLVVLTEQCGYR